MVAKTEVSGWRVVALLRGGELVVVRLRHCDDWSHSTGSFEISDGSQTEFLLGAVDKAGLQCRVENGVPTAEVTDHEGRFARRRYSQRLVGSVFASNGQQLEPVDSRWEAMKPWSTRR